jgi:hypothetical protein
MNRITRAPGVVPPYNVQMWLFGGAAVSAILLIAILWKIAFDRHRKRQNRLMRDHLFRSYSTPE